jgi:hypothetical protein
LRQRSRSASQTREPSNVAAVAVVASHFQQPCVAICPINRSDKSPHDRTLPFDQRRPQCVTIRFGLTASLGQNGFRLVPKWLHPGRRGANRHGARVYVIEFDDGEPRRIQETIEAGLRRCSLKSTCCFLKTLRKGLPDQSQTHNDGGPRVIRLISPSGFPQTHGHEFQSAVDRPPSAIASQAPAPRAGAVLRRSSRPVASAIGYSAFGRSRPLRGATMIHTVLWLTGAVTWAL